MTAAPGRGGDDDAEFRCRLRADPPVGALLWLVETLSDVRVVEAMAMRGESSAAVHLVTTVDAQDYSHQVALRRYLRADQQAEHPSCALVEVGQHGLQRQDLPSTLERVHRLVAEPAR